ncbi:RADICAL-INDUCED CELL DEATH1, ARABIDOPSIS THALIANA P8 (INTERACTING PROTEIN), REDOX IMBALANCED 1 [Hibiscus trionum]|uniref:RADICAL-INDUCED CELL DEATH1, ARABIDOPSIS THALIANA P8 (INTERACTING PROTEIN), REDOX IMBALANCED 1 n=1 Tax=Hibiscus trionum TaxID=183268 RepID=A0A9W7M7L7_HIBTR|nr:RADICAL-INDUCED CELL DEATH1, ARABIDOPSIS THALIANA P8 (INTERACTING PROTEIN), REDOX IMBALANCED 1 [Hibiscus trionum]
MTKNLVESVGFRAPPPPPSISSPRSPRNRAGGGCSARSAFWKRAFSQNNSNFGRSAVPLRFMYFRNDSWNNFSAEVVESLRAGFLEQKPIVEASIDGAKYIFDLKRMLQIEYSTGNCRSISWIDESGKCFFPSDFFSEEEFMQSECSDWDDNTSCNYKNRDNNFNPKIEIEVKIDRSSCKRKREEEPEVSSSYKAAVGNGAIKCQRLEEGGAAEWPNTKQLKETERAYLLINDHFLSGITKHDAGVRIAAINQCKWEAHLDKVRLEVFQKQIEITKAARGTSNMVYAWFGASTKVVESILAHGFGLPSKLPATDVYGIGVYLSPLGLPHLSANLVDADDNGVKHLILCRVILGNVEKVEAGSEQYLPSSVDFDTGSDDPMNPKWYIVWSTNANMHVLPESVVSFRPSSNMQGHPRPTMGVKYSLDRLFSKIRNSLPPLKVREILTTYSTYKAGMIAKDAFTRKLREVAGDEVLRSAIQEINASG